MFRRPSTANIVLTALFLCLSSIALARPADPDYTIPVVDPFTDPKDDFNNPFRYIPSDKLSAVAVAFFITTSIALSICMFKWGAKWMACMVIGGYAMTLGLALRFPLARNPDSEGLFIAEDLFVVLSPCAFIAGDYILLGRLAAKYDLRKYLLIRPERITRVFITSDITTFLIQAFGGGLTTVRSLKISQTGAHIFLAGLTLQLVSFLFFTCIYLWFLYQVRRDEPQMWAGTDARLKGRREATTWINDWRTLAAIMIVSCIGILIRSVYRTIENSQGYHGKLATTEWCFYVFDTLPLFLAITVYIPFWPGRFLEFPIAIDNGETGVGSETSERTRIENENEMEVISPIEKEKVDTAGA